MTVTVINPGLLTTIQDLGRPGYFHLGIPVGGAMDRRALIAANLLVGNDEGAAGLEAVFMGPELEFADDRIVAVCGADLPPKVDGTEMPTWTSFRVKGGQRLTFDYLKSGARAYIAISGGIDTPLALGSRSTYPIGALGGFKGRAIAAGDELPLGPSDLPKDGRYIPTELRRIPTGDVELRALPGLYIHRITAASQTAFFEDTWTVAPEADRMGYRFRGGRPMEFVEREQPFGAGSDPSNITDACYPYGSIQIPGGTEPIVLHRDAVSGGGYFMVGTVISADMDLIGQLQPNKTVRFVAVTMDEALAARHEQRAEFAKLRDSIA
ncbi:biotin-dependent carboxyltransferase family protein [Acuticoccus sp. M5D2P5]|uniref:5-oxoprolinase subunit C family protein n=1 Tax=Acuticoccus kalidii TaxID=2910977 RepID=UPI001F3A82B5|nr:biotin-dependent carboxyltransferase family protein [Acuticoccus kalidii]MCF3934228.1 biotin-dependent carboxyltransferase family protein [Acuticoccus kalidii]